MFVQSEKFVQAHGGRIADLSIFGQESNATTTTCTQTSRPTSSWRIRPST
jgi:hypothetical protein